MFRLPFLLAPRKELFDSSHWQKKAPIHARKLDEAILGVEGNGVFILRVHNHGSGCNLLAGSKGPMQSVHQQSLPQSPTAETVTYRKTSE